MAYRGVLDEVPSFSQQLGRGLGKGLGSGISKGVDFANKIISANAKKKAKTLEKLPSDSKKWLKQFGEPFLNNEKAYNEFRDRATKLVQDGYDPEDAFSLAKESFNKNQLSEFGASPKRGLMDILNPSRRNSSGLVGEFLDPALQAAKEKPSLLASELPNAVLKSGKSAEMTHDPSSLISSTGDLAYRLMGKSSPFKGGGGEKVISDRLRRGVPEHLHEGAERISDIESALMDLLVPVELEGSVAKKALGAAEKGLAERAGKGVEDATKMRMSRMAPESRLFKTGEQTKILQDQLKLYPKYAAEIAADAEKRTATLNRVMGPRALATKESRMALAQKQLPDASRAYQTSISRVRALENEIARLPEQAAAKLEPLLEAAKNELKDSEFFLKQMLNNSKTGEARVGLEEMRRAAHQKMVDLEGSAMEGKQFALGKADYNPEHIHRAKQLAKRKQIPSSGKMNDFYTDVHDAYSKEYSKRLSQLESEIGKPPASVFEGMSKKAKITQRDVLKKMIDSAEAENTLHRHNLSLREMNQRKLAKDRLGSTIQRSEAPKVSEAAKSGIENQARISEGLKTAEGRTKLAEEVINYAARENPKLAGQIEKEGSSLTEALGKVKSQSEKIQSAAQQTAKTERDQVNIFRKVSDDFAQAIEALNKKDLSVFKTRIGKDFLIALGTQTASEIAEEFDLQLPSATVISAFIGSPRGSGYRAFFSWMIRGGINKFKKENYKAALRDFDYEKVKSLKEKYKPKIIREASKEMESPVF